jgi:peptidoglycan/LPS O-acetylase OafA/YrhL
MPTPQPAPSFERFAGTRVFGSLDGLRCLSIVAVVWHHSRLHASPPGLLAHGFLGVDLFFVISGFLITTLLLRERAQTGGISLGRFWMRRTLRIFPPYFALLFLVAIALGLIFPGARMRQPFFAELPYLVTYTSNWIEVTTLFAITWSLATEEQFYLVWPTLERFAARFVAPAIAGALLLNQALNFGWLDGAVEAVTGLPRSALPVLQATFTPILLGAALAHGLAAEGPFRRIAGLLGARWAAPAALALVLALAASPGSLTGGPRLAIHLAMTGLVAACVVREDNGLASALRFGPAARIGAVSYGVYLYHLFAMHAVGRLGDVLGGVESSALRFGATLALSVVVAEISYRWFESRFLRLKTRFEPRASR